jgi:hypothetical protein
VKPGTASEVGLLMRRRRRTADHRFASDRVNANERAPAARGFAESAGVAPGAHFRPVKNDFDKMYPLTIR